MLQLLLIPLEGLYLIPQPLYLSFIILLTIGLHKLDLVALVGEEELVPLFTQFLDLLG